jgi:hypothetical protein
MSSWQPAIGSISRASLIFYLSQTSILSALRLNGRFPILDENFQSSVPGLYMAGLMATKDFGPFYGFVRGCPTIELLAARSRNDWRALGDDLRTFLLMT